MFVIVLLGLSFLWINYRDIPFDSSEWINGDDTVRRKMASDLISSQILHSASKAKVRNLLGEPDQIFEDFEQEHVWIYVSAKDGVRASGRPLKLTFVQDETKWVLTEYGMFD